MSHGVGPHPMPWPEGDRFDPTLLKAGDTRNVLDKYRYWKESAIQADIDSRGIELEVALENLERDFNMGTIVRSANAFGVRTVHIVGRKTWNKRGAMATDKYLRIVYHTPESFLDYIRTTKRTLVAVDITDTSKPLSGYTIPQNAVMLFGSEGSGISDQLLGAADTVVHIEQFGSTRSLNVGVAAGVALYQWVRDNHLTRYM